MRAYEYRHIVSFEETNLVGNVYYVNHLRWQGHTREMFLRDHAPEILRQLSEGLSLATVRCACDYLSEPYAFDEILIRMRLVETVQNRITLSFDYSRVRGGAEELVARGEQQIACLLRDGPRLAPTPIPPALRAALEAFR